LMNIMSAHSKKPIEKSDYPSIDRRKSNNSNIRPPQTQRIEYNGSIPGNTNMEVDSLFDSISII